MFFFRKKKLALKKEFYPEDDKVHLYWGTYGAESDEQENYRAFLVVPGEEIDTEDYRKLALDCAANILLGSPVVLNVLYCNSLEPVEGTLSEDECVKQYVAKGGTPIFVAKNALYTVNQGIDRQLIECIPKDAYGYYGFCFYRHNLERDSSFKHNLTIHYHEDHQYLEVSAPEIVSEYVDIVLEVCKKHGKQVVLPKE